MSGAFLIRLLSSLVSLALTCYGVYWLKENYPPAKAFLARVITSSEVNLLQPRFSLEQITEKTSKKGHLTSSEILYSPYALLEVKYSRSSHKTDEAVMLFDLTSGELVMNTKTWECTHGLQDCLTAQVNHSDFKILKALSKGPLNRQNLSDEVKMASSLLEESLKRCRSKKLIVQKENDFRIHLDTPRLPSRPVTKTEYPLSTKTSASCHTLKARYSISDITELATALFEDDFSIRSSWEVYVPIYSLTFTTSDGTLSTVYVNALSGKELKT